MDKGAQERGKEAYYQFEARKLRDYFLKDGKAYVNIADIDKRGSDGLLTKKGYDNEPEHYDSAGYISFENPETIYKLAEMLMARGQDAKSFVQKKYSERVINDLPQEKRDELMI